MTDQQSQSNTDPTTQLQRTTMNQGREALEQLLNVQRSMAQLTLSALQWQQTAQKQGMEMSQSMLDQFPGQEFTQSMLESYLEGMETMAPEMERALERGAAAGTAAQAGARSQSEVQPQSQHQPQSQPQARTPPTRGAQRSGREPSMEGHTAQMGRQQPSAGETGHRQTGDQHAERTRRQMGRQPQQRQSQQPTEAYPQTGEWIERGQSQARSQSQPRENQGTTYGGESASATSPEHRVQENQSSEQPTARHDQERRPEQRNDQSGRPAGRMSQQRSHSQQRQHDQQGKHNQHEQ